MTTPNQAPVSEYRDALDRWDALRLYTAEFQRKTGRWPVNEEAFVAGALWASHRAGPITLALRRDLEAALGALRDALQLSGGWREAIVELEDWCREPVRLKNMLAAADQLDEWKAKTRAILAAHEKVGGEEG